jgi:uncharacterized protein YndB with AHSA1/START domain
VKQTGIGSSQATEEKMASESGRLMLHLQTVVPAPSARVFTALIDREDLARWWGPAGFVTPAIELDPRERGTYRFGMQPPEGELFYLTGEFIEFDPPHRLAYTFRWEDPDPDDVETVATLTLRDLGGSTELVLEQGPFATEPRRALHEAGWTDGFEKIRRLLSDEGRTPII